MSEKTDNPAEYTTCDQCGVRRKLPEPCRCERRGCYGTVK